jgi:hypothetical protein
VEPVLLLHNRPIASVFELLGLRENDITYSLGWALKKSEGLRQALLRRVFPDQPKLHVESIELQERDSDKGITDIELSGPGLHVIIEAKRGWEVPTTDQLSLYEPRLRRGNGSFTSFVTMSECTAEFARSRLEPTIRGVPVVHIGWHDIDSMAATTAGSQAEKRLLAELRAYLSRIVKMQNQGSNMVFVVVLAADTPEWSTLSWKEMVEKKGRYFHPVGVDGWPKFPPNYIGFRYGGQLRSIHHVDGCKTVTEITSEMPELTPGVWSAPHYLYTLGPAIYPPKPVKNGAIYPNGRYKAMFDLLLTSETIAEACERTKARQPDED